MCKELVIVFGLPYSGKTTWISQKYTEENTVVIEETAYPKLFKDGKYVENELYNSVGWVSEMAKEQFEKGTQRIVVSLVQSRPDHWVDLLELAKTHEYSVSVVKPTNGSLFYKNNKFGNMFDQIAFLQTATVNQFPKQVKDKKKVQEDEDAPKENPNLFGNLNNEFLSAYNFLSYNTMRACENSAEKWLKVINETYKAAILKEQQYKKAREIRIAREIEKVAKAKREAELKEKQEAEATEAAKKAAESIFDQEENKEVVTTA